MLHVSFQERANMIQKALGLDKGRTDEAKMNSVADTSSAGDILALAKKNSAPEENNAKGKATPPFGDQIAPVPET
jgi:hypothetical protein